MTTPDRRILPAAQAVLIDRTGRATQPFYDFLRRLIDVTQLTPELIAEIEALVALIDSGAFLPNTANVVGAQSVHSTGTLAAGLVTLNLVNDTSSQQGTWYYGSNATAQKGWHRFFTALAGGAGIQIRNSGFIELGELDNAADLPPVGNSGEAYWVRGIFNPAELGLWAWNGASWQLEANASGIVSFEVANADYGDITVSADGATWTIDDDAVTDAKLRDSAALSVIGRSADSAGDPADIVAAANDTVLRRTGDALDFGQLTAGMAPDAVWPYAKLQDAAALSVLGRAGSTPGVLADIVAAANDTVQRRVGDALGFGQLTVNMAPDGLWTYAKLQDVSAASKLLGRGDSGAGEVEEITLGSGLTMTGTTLSASGGGATVLSAFKPADTSRNNTTTLADDPHLIFTGLAAGRYAVDGFLNVVGGATPDFKLAWRCDNVGVDTSFVQTLGVDQSTGAIGACNLNAFAASPFAGAFGLSGNQFGIAVHGILIVTAAASTAAFQWAQNTSDAGNVTVREGGWLTLTPE